MHSSVTCSASVGANIFCQSDSASKKREHFRIEFMPEVLFITWRSIYGAV